MFKQKNGNKNDSIGIYIDLSCPSPCRHFWGTSPFDSQALEEAVPFAHQYSGLRVDGTDPKRWLIWTPI